MCPMCDQAIGDYPPAVCPRCGWELLQLAETTVSAAERSTPAPRGMAVPSASEDL
jgi:rRNA maturation endonuclease Nob1